MEFELKNISVADLSKLDDLYYSDLGLNFPISSKLNTFYSEFQYLGCLAFSNSDIVCAYLTYPLEVILNNNKYIIGQSGDSITKINFLGNNLITKCGVSNYENLKKNNFYGVFGFPSKNILRTRLKMLNWTKSYDMISSTIFVPTIPFYFFNKNKFIYSLHKKWVKFIVNLFYKKGDYFDSSNCIPNNDYVIRSNRFWKYKMSNENNFLIKISGVDIVLKFDKVMYIGDINLTQIQNKHLFNFKLKIFFFITFNIIIKTYTSPNSELYRYLKGISKFSQSLSFCYLDFYRNITLKNLNFTYFDYDTF